MSFNISIFRCFYIQSRHMYIEQEENSKINKKRDDREIEIDWV
jgi:hypothetical protein